MAINKVSIRSIKIPKNKTHKATSWQVATTPRFEDDDIVKNIEKDEDHLYEMSFDLDYTKFDLYYARVKLHFDDDTVYGWTKPITLTKNGDGFSHTNSVIVTPILKVTTDKLNADLGGFRIKGNDFILFSGSGFHKYTDWYIKDTNGRVIWKREMDKYNLTSIRVPNHILEPNKIYVIEAAYWSDGKVKSNTGKLIIKTAGINPLVKEIGVADKRVTAEEYEKLEDAYNELLEFTVSQLATINIEQCAELHRMYNELLKKYSDCQQDK